jgi:hypothetical protein
MGPLETDRGDDKFVDQGFQGNLDMEDVLDQLVRKKVSLMSEERDFTEHKRSIRKSKRGRLSKYQSMLEAEDEDEQADEEEY